MFAILRSYNNRRIESLMHNLESIEAIDSVVVVINAGKDNDPSSDDPFDTVLFLDAIQNSTLLSIKTVLLADADYGWSKALNAGIAMVPVEEEFVAMISSEVEITNDEFEQLLHAAAQPDSSCGYALYDGTMAETRHRIGTPGIHASFGKENFSAAFCSMRTWTELLSFPNVEEWRMSTLFCE